MSWFFITTQTHVSVEWRATMCNIPQHQHISCMIQPPLNTKTLRYLLSVCVCVCVRRTIQPGGQEHSPVTWWHTPPFWHGQRSSHRRPCFPGGHTSSQLHTNQRRAQKFRHTLISATYTCVFVLTMLQCNRGRTHTLRSCDGMLRCFDTDTCVGSCVRRWSAHKSPHSASRCIRPNRCTLRSWGYTTPRSYTDND